MPPNHPGSSCPSCAYERRKDIRFRDKSFRAASCQAKRLPLYKVRANSSLYLYLYHFHYSLDYFVLVVQTVINRFDTFLKRELMGYDLLYRNRS